MHPELEGIVAADEEGRARVALEEERCSGEVSAARAASAAAIGNRRRAHVDALAKELQAIREEGEARVAELERRQREFLDALARTGEARLEEAVALYLRIVGEVSA